MLLFLFFSFYFIFFFTAKITTGCTLGWVKEREREREKEKEDRTIPMGVFACEMKVLDEGRKTTEIDYLGVDLSG